MYMFLLVSTLGLLFVMIPDFQLPSISSYLFIGGLALILSIGIAINNNPQKRIWVISLIASLCIPVLMLSGAIHFLKYILSGWIWIAALVLIFILAWVLPILNIQLAKRVSDEQFAPRTFLGRGCLTLALSIGGSAGTLGASIGRFGHQYFGFTPMLAVLGILLSILSIALAQTFSYQIWEQRPWRETQP